MIASNIIHIVYFASLIEAYGHGDLRQIYRSRAAARRY